ncbi:MAG: aldo/keto reductase [Pelagibacterium sp.]|uniref:aldo/keto reductase n=1 Tax=Pelagibacterium sp. TaxID=1967288 RepID=UPI0032EDB102
MKYVNLGSTGLKISRICLGCMSYGDSNKGEHGWVLDEQQGRPFLKASLDAGINFFDTANIYSDGASEEVLGRAIKDFAVRDDVVLSTKVHGKMRDNVNGGGLSRKAIFAEVDASRRRLGTDFLDILQIHRWDYETPIEETLEALDAVVRQGKVRYLGASSMHAWQFMKALGLQRAHGWANFVMMQNHVNLLYREEEREMLPLCRSEGIGVTPWSPLARGRLTRGPEGNSDSARYATDNVGARYYARAGEADNEIIDRVGELAARRERSRAEIALSWLLHKPGISAPVVGATKPHHLEAALAAVDISLEPDEVAYLEEPYVPRPISGHS